LSNPPQVHVGAKHLLAMIRATRGPAGQMLRPYREHASLSNDLAAALHLARSYLPQRCTRPIMSSQSDSETTQGASRMKWSYRIATLRGIDIRIHLTFPLIVLYAMYEGSRTYGAVWQGALFGAASVSLLFVCVILHELAHSLQAIALASASARSPCSPSAASRNSPPAQSGLRTNFASPLSAR